jgi:PHD/YefM family antitoxin component YafN of YafNO toxin-antitoxin module
VRQLLLEDVLVPKVKLSAERTSIAMVGAEMNVATASRKKFALSMMMDTTNLLPTNTAQRLLKEAARAQKVKRSVVRT